MLCTALQSAAYPSLTLATRCFISSAIRFASLSLSAAWPGDSPAHRRTTATFVSSVAARTALGFPFPALALALAWHSPVNRQSNSLRRCWRKLSPLRAFSVAATQTRHDTNQNKSCGNADLETLVSAEPNVVLEAAEGHHHRRRQPPPPPPPPRQGTPATCNDMSVLPFTMYGSALIGNICILPRSHSAAGNEAALPDEPAQRSGKGEASRARMRSWVRAMRLRVRAMRSSRG